MNILGVNISHNGSVCVVSEGKVKFYLEADRKIKEKNCSPSFEFLKEISKNFLINKIVVTGLNHQHSFEYISKYFDKLKILFPKSQLIDLRHQHHLTHATSAFFNSGFDKCLNVVIDGMGSLKFYKNDKKYPIGETESIYKISYNHKPSLLYKNFISGNKTFQDKNVTNKLTLGIFWSGLCEFFGFDSFSSGKIMGLSSYGKFNKKLNSLFKGSYINPNYFTYSVSKTGIKVEPNIKLNPNPKLWHQDKTQILDIEKDLAYHTQYKSQQIVGNLIEEYLNKTNYKKICCSGGYFLNCVSNYYLIKRFPNIKFYFEPIAHDGGTAIGGALYIWYLETKIKPSFQNSLYYGPKYSKKQIIDGIKKYL